jgi:hypothetical protein
MRTLAARVKRRHIPCPIGVVSSGRRVCSHFHYRTFSDRDATATLPSRALSGPPSFPEALIDTGWEHAIMACAESADLVQFVDTLVQIRRTSHHLRDGRGAFRPRSAGGLAYPVRAREEPHPHPLFSRSHLPLDP